LSVEVLSMKTVIGPVMRALIGPIVAVGAGFASFDANIGVEADMGPTGTSAMNGGGNVPGVMLDVASLCGQARTQNNKHPPGYFPSEGRKPGYGRHEIEPPRDRVLPPRAPSYHRSWSSDSDPAGPSPGLATASTRTLGNAHDLVAVGGKADMHYGFVRGGGASS
jgi:hypothetical protein